MKILAYYLPQFHEIPENNAWWGKGFTEWTNVKKAKPLFEGHNMPRVPLDQRYYDLTDVETQRWQVDLAKKYGIYGFCMYHYWFNGHMLLEKPIDQYLKHKELDLPFCLCWANENWTNGWVSSDNKLLIAHDNTDKQDWIEHFRYFLPFFQDERYIRVDGKPLLILYFPDILQKCSEMISVWRELAVKNGLPGLHILYQKAMTHFNRRVDKSCFDGGIEFQPGYALVKKNTRMQRMYSAMRIRLSTFLRVKMHVNLSREEKKALVYHLNYDQVWNDILSLRPDTPNMYPGAFVDWDNTPRKGCRGSLYDGVTPQKFAEYMTQQVKNAKENYHTDIMFIFAWNEWGESGYLEPDTHYGYGFLEGVRAALLANDAFPEYPAFEMKEIKSSQEDGND